MSAGIQTEMKIVKIDQIQEGFNPRSDFSKVEEIAMSIRSVGLLHPIVVVPAKKNGSAEEYVVVDGAQRLKALKKLNIDQTQVRIVDPRVADEAQISANLMRADLNVLERARGFERLARTFPSKYNEQSIAKTFGCSPSMAKRLISIAKRIPTAFDKRLSPMLGQLGMPDLEMIAALPVAGVMENVIAKLDPKDPDVERALRKFAHQLDYVGDAVNTGALVSAGNAFVVKTEYGEEVWTASKQVYDDAKAAYEKKQKAQYGSGSETSRKLSEKEKTARRTKIAKDRKERAEAIKELPAVLKKFIGSKPTEKEMDDLGEEICRQNLNFDASRRLAALFGQQLRNSSYGCRAACWKQIFKPLCTTPESLVKLYAFTKKVGYNREQDWLKALKK